ncbi:MAG: DUF561 domain-containing protein [Stenomitos frigidus ULC029]
MREKRETTFHPNLPKIRKFSGERSFKLEGEILVAHLVIVLAPFAAIAAGASGSGVGSAINQLNSEVAMIAAVRSLVEALVAVSRKPLCV